MPAINLTRLKKQVDALLATVDDPDRFWQHFADLLDFYTNRTARALPRPGDYLPTLHTPEPLLREIERQLAPLAAAAPQRVMPVILRLWQENLLEAHQLAARLLGRIPPQTPNWLDVTTAWVATTRDPRVRHTLLTDTLARLRQENPDRFLRLLQNWLRGNTPTPTWNYALIALQPYLQQTTAEHLPPVFSLLAPVITALTPPLQPQMAQILTRLHQLSPAETRYFLRETLPQVQTPLSQRTLRRLSASLPDDLRPLVRKYLPSSASRTP